MPRHDESERRATARAMTCADRIHVIADRGPSPHRARTAFHGHPEFLGLMSFAQWLISSGRIADGGGSPWWMAVNGLILTDIADSGRQRHPADPGNPADPANPVNPVNPVQSWIRYRDATSRSKRRAMWWAAHQHSLEAACRSSEGLLAAEPLNERLFIELTLTSVGIASAGRLSTRRIGSMAIKEFCATLYPDHYPAGEDAGRAASDLIERHGESRLAGTRIVGSLLANHMKAGSIAPS